MKKKYLPILTETTKKTFFDYIDSLDVPQIDYFAIGVQNTLDKTSISLMSRQEWQKHFVINQYAEHDPLRQVTLYTKRNLISFNEIDFINNYGKEIMHQRVLMDIKKGIVLMARFPKFNYMITLGTGFSKFDAFDFIKRYHDKIRLIKNDLIRLIEKDANNFLPKEVRKHVNHPSTDAK